MFAGDIPESIMLGEQQALFIGGISDYGDETYTITIIDLLMGHVSESQISVKKFSYYGNTLEPKIGDYVVAVLIEDNSIHNSWIFKCTSTDYRTLKLVSRNYNMVKRYEQYINQGKYQEAQRNLEKNETTTSLTNIQQEVVEDINNSLSTRRNIAILGFSVLLLAVLIYMFILRKTRN